MARITTRLARADDLWLVRVTGPEGEKLEYTYGSERQARYFAAIFQLGPARLPPPPPPPPKVARKLDRASVWANAAYRGVR